MTGLICVLGASQPYIACASGRWRAGGGYVRWEGRGTCGGLVLIVVVISRNTSAVSSTDGVVDS